VIELLVGMLHKVKHVYFILASLQEHHLLFVHHCEGIDVIFEAMREESFAFFVAVDEDVLVDS